MSDMIGARDESGHALDPAQVLLLGVEILDPVLVPRGFRFIAGATDTGSGGRFASGEYVRGDHRLELHFRHSLGLVRYHVGALSIGHREYMECLHGPDGGHRYPGFSADPLDGFRHLAYDLERFAADFTAGTGEQIRDCAGQAQPATGMKRLSRVERVRTTMADGGRKRGP
jgi:hypothetical protein